MKYFEAISAKQLDICLRLLYSEGICFTVEIKEINKDKAIYHIKVEEDNQKIDKISELYRVLIL